MLHRRTFLIATLSSMAPATRLRANDPWMALRNGQAVALLRHAIAPGTGDPPGFSVDNCSTQRNLSQEGRDQARRIGELFRRNGISEARVFSSQWCRCLDTARLLDLGPVTEQPFLNSFFGRAEDGRQQTLDLRNWMTGIGTGAPVILVTHQVNITALTGVYPASGEILFVTPADQLPLDTIGRISGGN